MTSRGHATRTLTIAAKGQVTLRKDLLKHLGVHPGKKAELVALALPALCELVWVLSQR